jgi:valacyclovir hydrolase
MSWFEQGPSRIYYEETGRGEPVLFMPGFSDSIGSHLPLRDLLSASYKVVAVDLPGSGRSEPQPRSYAAGYHADDAHALAALLETITGGPAHLVGYSDGGEVALLMAALYPQLARSVVTWGAVGFASDPSGEVRAAFYNVVDDPVPSFEAYSRQLVSAYGARCARAMTQSFSKAITAIIDAGGDISRSKAHNITCPVLLIVGEHDTANPIDLAEQYVAAVKIGRAIEVKGAGHDVHIAQPDWFTATVTDWLASAE